MGPPIRLKSRSGGRVPEGYRESERPLRKRHTCHILPPSEIDLRCLGLILQAQEGNIYFTELAERVEYGNYVIIIIFIII